MEQPDPHVTTACVIGDLMQTLEWRLFRAISNALDGRGLPPSLKQDLRAVVKQGVHDTAVRIQSAVDVLSYLLTHATDPVSEMLARISLSTYRKEADQALREAGDAVGPDDL